jgi:hypothetical protein
VRRLAEAKPTIFFNSNEDKGYYKFYDGRATFVEISDQDPLASNREIWVLADDTPPTLLWKGYRDWLIVHATSPAGNKFHEWSKQTVARVLYMDLWSWREIILAR